jgi:hypothetical protein
MVDNIFAFTKEGYQFIAVFMDIVCRGWKARLAGLYFHQYGGNCGLWVFGFK